VIKLTFKKSRLVTFASVSNSATLKSTFLIFSTLFLSYYSFAQQPREVQDQNHFWWSLNTSAKISNHWSLAADLHIRRTNFLSNNSFYYVRLGIGYAVTDKFSIIAGLSHMWLANKSGATELFSNENRIHQQAQLNSIVNKIVVSNRLRIEERWVQKLVNFQPINKYRYTTRFRYQLSLNIPVSKKKKVPSLVIADEVMLQTGKDIIYNPFDQNRIFGGIKQQLTKSLSFDFGYMHVWQQKLSGYQYSRNHTIRWFFYWQPDWRRKTKPVGTAFHLPDEL
jgi:hypothetical protein